MNRNNTLDVLKGVGIFLVVLGHATFVNDRIITFIFSFHMPLFFIVSGMLMKIKAESESSFSIFIRKKLRSIAIPYLSFSICYIIIDFLSVYYQQISYSDLKINAICTLSLAGSGPLWFLPTLMISQIFLFLIIKRFNLWQALILSLALAAIGFSGSSFFLPYYELHKSSLISLFYLNFVLVLLRSLICLALIAPGYALYDIVAKLESRFSIVQFLSGIALLVAVFLLSFNNVNLDLHNLNYGKIYIFLPCAYFGTLGLYLICNTLPKLKLLEFWGKNSLVIMVTHLNFYLLYVGNLFAHAVNPYITRAKSYIFLFNILLVTMILCSFLICLINKFLPWMVGKRPNKRQ